MAPTDVYEQELDTIVDDWNDGTKVQSILKHLKAEFEVYQTG